MTAFDSAVFLLRHSVVDAEPFIHSDWIDFPDLIAERHWSDGETAVILAAWDLFNGCGGCTLDRLLANCDSEHYALVVRALELRRPEAFTSNLVPNNVYVTP